MDFKGAENVGVNFQHGQMIVKLKMAFYSQRGVAVQVDELEELNEIVMNSIK